MGEPAKSPWKPFVAGGRQLLLAVAVVMLATACHPDHASDAGTHADAGSPASDAGGPASDAGSRDASPTEEPPACEVDAPTACPDSELGFADVEPILESHCVTCHGGVEDGPWPLTTYEHVASWYSELRTVMLDCSMPPPETRPSMTNAERQLLLAWLRCGFPR